MSGKKRPKGVGVRLIFSSPPPTLRYYKMTARNANKIIECLALHAKRIYLQLALNFFTDARHVWMNENGQQP